MHLAVVKINLHIHDPIACQDALTARVVDAFFHGRHEHTIHILADQRVGELQAGVARPGFNTHPDFGELAGATGLFLVTILRVGARFDGFAVADFRFDQFDIDFVPAFQAVHHHAQMQIALGGDHCLVQLRVHMK